jgi:hypothetical protein
MARTSTGNKKGLEAFAVLMQWRSENIPEFITSYEAWNLTGGIVGKKDSVEEFRLIDVAVKYTARYGSLADYLAMKAGA